MLSTLQKARLSPVYGRLLHKLMEDSYVSIDKAGERLGFAPRLSNRDAILRTYDWWRTARHDRPAGSPTGRTSRDPWSQGLLSAVKIFF